MEWKQILSLDANELTEDNKEAIFEIFSREEKPKIRDKSAYKKLFRFAQIVLKFKGEQINSLEAELETFAGKQQENEAYVKGSPSSDRNEIERLNTLIETLETDKTNYKSRIKDLSEEINILQKKIHENGSHFGDRSEREDSPDALSEIDRQEELYKNIHTKNKHIKRLLRDIETLEKQNLAHVTTINELKATLSDATLNLTTLTMQFTESQTMITEQRLALEEKISIITDLKEQIELMQKERVAKEREIQAFGVKLEERAGLWRQKLEEKDQEIEELKQKCQRVVEQNPGYDIDAERCEISRMTKTLAERDDTINELEQLLDKLKNEMIGATNLFNKMSASREDLSQRGQNAAPNGSCCKEAKMLLDKATERCKDLQDMLAQTESDSSLKAKQALEAIEALRAYESGEDGLSDALQKIQRLQQKVKSRDKQIHALVMELNGLNEVTAENHVMRKQLGLADDDLIVTTGVLAKLRKSEKAVERLTLKLRASEEMRLQLKLDRNELKRKLSSLNQKVHKMSVAPTAQHPDGKETDTSSAEGQANDSVISEIRLCEHCCNQYEKSRVPKNDKEIVKTVSLTQHQEKMDEHAKKYKTVVEENENLRIGMHEILEKLREYDATSNHITIDATTLEKLLYALDARSISGWYHPAMRIQSELMVTKEREIALREKIKTNQKVLDDKLSSLEKEGTTPDVSHMTVDSRSIEEITSLKEQLIDLETKFNNLVIQNDELKLAERQYSDLVETLKASDSEQERKLIEKIEKLNAIEVNVCKYKRKLEYFQLENDSVNEQLKTLRADHAKTIFELRKELTTKATELQMMRNSRKSALETVTRAEFEKVVDENKALRQNLSQLTGKFFKNFSQINQDAGLLDVKDTESFNTVALIEDNLHVDFLPKSELNDLTARLKASVHELNALKIEKEQLVQLLAIANEQITSQQAMLTRSSDDEIELRHLIADLQSQSNEKYLLVKTKKQLDTARSNEGVLSKELADLKGKFGTLGSQCEKTGPALHAELEKKQKGDKNETLQIQYMKKILDDLRSAYMQHAPLLQIVSFIRLYSEVYDLKSTYEHKVKIAEVNNQEAGMEALTERMKNELNGNDVQDRINLIKYKSQCEFLTKQLILSEEAVKTLQIEVKNLVLESLERRQHLETLAMLFSEKNPVESVALELTKEDKDVQTLHPETHDQHTETDVVENEVIIEQKCATKDGQTQTTVESVDTEDSYSIKYLESQLKQAMALASTRSTLLLETENRLAEYQGRIKSLEKIVDEKETTLKSEREKNGSGTNETDKTSDNILSITIASLQNLLLEKDTTLSRYQDLLKTERQENAKFYDDYQNQVKTLKSNISDLEAQISAKDVEIQALKRDIREAEQKISTTPPVELEKSDFNEDAKLLDELYKNDNDNFVLKISEQTVEIESLHHKLHDHENELRKLQQQLRDACNREKLWEKTISDKEQEIEMMREKLSVGAKLPQASQKLEIIEINENIVATREIEQLQEILEERDRHITDLTDTLAHFHDDQQKFLTDTTLQTAEQVSQLSADLNRCEATNRVMRTQVEALKRQIVTVEQREKQARELVKNLKTQLIRRPVISMKTDRIFSTMDDQAQRKVKQLETELAETKEELRKKAGQLEMRRNKSASDLGLWDKQKRWQQSAEKLKQKLTEREGELDKLRSLNNSAKTTITRLEREKQILEQRTRGLRCCGSGSCPNLASNKYTTAESPESYASTTSDSDTVVRGGSSASLRSKPVLPENREIIESLKARIESQQRRIVAMELEGKGSNAITHEMERLHEQLSNMEAQNIRLEAKNLQLQLDSDRTRQTDVVAERLKRQIKHLEDYIEVLKNELAQAMAKISAAKDSAGTDSKPSSAGQHSQTILALRRVIEKLKIENKLLRDGKKPPSADSPSPAGAQDALNELKEEYEKCKQQLIEALDEISAIKIELELQQSTAVCSTCHKGDESLSPDLEGDKDDEYEMKSIKEKLAQKTQLLEKAKLLLTRAAAKEKNLKEQIKFLRRRCSELQNIPIIDECSE